MTLLVILSSMAEGESTSISENSKWSIKKRFQNGTFKLSYAPYGYRWDGRTLRVVPEQDEVVKRIFSDVLSGKGTDAIAKELDDEGVPTKRGGKWTSTSVRGIIANEKYTGDVIFQKTYTDDSFNRHTNKGELDMYYVADHHEAIISKEDFEAAGFLIAQRASEKGIKAKAKYIRSVMHSLEKSSAMNVAIHSKEECTIAHMANTQLGAAALIWQIKTSAR